MTLNDLFEKVLIRSGQFQYPSERIELNAEPFKKLVESCLGVYNGYVPVAKHVFKSINGSRQYKFTEETDGEIPEWVSNIVPVRIAGVVPYYFREYDRPKGSVDVKQEYPFEYRKPIITVPVSADYDIYCVYNHKLTPVDDSDSKEWEILTIDDQAHEFLDLVTARFLIGLGRSRRAFTISDVPIIADSADLVSEGKDMEEKTMEDLYDRQSRFYLAWGG
jgi:hypothetical protein